MLIWFWEYIETEFYQSKLKIILFFNALITIFLFLLIFSTFLNPHIMCNMNQRPDGFVYIVFECFLWKQNSIETVKIRLDNPDTKFVALDDKTYEKCKRVAFNPALKSSKDQRTYSISFMAKDDRPLN